MQLAERIKNHRHVAGLFVEFRRQCQGTLECLLRAIPLANEDQINCEVVVAVCGATLMVRAFVVIDRFLEIANAFLRTFKVPAGAGHVRVDFAEHEAGGMIAD